PEFQGLFYSIDKSNLKVVSVWESGEYGRIHQKIYDSNNVVLDEASSNRDGYVQLLSIKPETANKAKSIQVVQNEWGEETSTSFEIEHKPIPIQIYQDALSESIQHNVDANQIWSLGVTDSLRWYFQQ